MLKLCTVGIFLALSIAKCSAINNITLHTGFNCTGFFSVITENDFADLDAIGMGNVSNSVEIDGSWILYNLPWYNDAEDAGVEYLSSTERICQDLNVTAGNLSSLRKANHDDGYGNVYDSLTVYSRTNYQSHQLATLESNSNDLYGIVYESLIIVGTSAWTIFQLPNFEGFAICLVPSETGPNNGSVLIPDLEQFDPSIPYGFIQSIWYGCVTDNIVQV